MKCKDTLSKGAWKRGLAVGAGVFLLCLCIGIMSGGYLRDHMDGADAASASITVTDNNQIVTEDQGTTTIVRTSTVTVRDAAATLGYRLFAKLVANSVPSATVSMYPTVDLTAPNTSTCTQASPCTLPVDDGSSNTAPLEILSTGDDVATQAAGDTTEWTVTITLPGATAEGNYIVDIAYSEDPILSASMPADPGTTLGAMQLLTNAACPTTRGTAYDIRNGQIYYVQKMAGLCWMETNLRYAGDGAWDASWGYADDRYATTAALAAGTANLNDDTRPLTGVSDSQASSSAVAQMADPVGSASLDTTTPTNNTTFYGYLYNWCAAMGGQQNTCDDTSTAGFEAAQSICPAGWRLPAEDGGGEFRSMTAAIGATNGAAGATNFKDQFLAVYSGRYDGGLELQGANGYFWSSNVFLNYVAGAYNLAYSPNSVSVSNNYYKRVGFAVRCVKDANSPLQEGMAMQDVTSSMCEKTALGATVNLVDQRDGKYYRVRKMADSRCWMIDNLAYDINSAPATGKPAYNPTAQLVSDATASVNNRAQYAQNTTAYNIPNNGNSTPSYLYNWCAAMGDTSVNCATTVGYGAGQPITPQTGICPAPFRLPITGATPSPSTLGNGTNQATAAATTTNEFAKLDIWLGGTGANRISANTYTNFTTDNATNPQLFWLGVLGGIYNSGPYSQGSYGYWWSSTAYSGTFAYNLYLNSGNTHVYPSSSSGKGVGFAVRCLL